MHTPKPTPSATNRKNAKVDSSVLCGHLEQGFEVAEATRGAVFVLGL